LVYSERIFNRCRDLFNWFDDKPREPRLQILSMYRPSKSDDCSCFVPPCGARSSGRPHTLLPSPTSFLFSNINMLKRIPTDPGAPFRKQDLTATQKARAEALRQAESDRAERRLENDARIDVNAAKWRFPSSTD